jgi:DNA-binding response OmpR family regulator
MSDTPINRRLRILVVENDVDTLKSLKRYLQRLGYSVSSATTVAEALHELQRSDCDVLLSDIGLPDGDGWELLRKAQFIRKPYCIAMSGYGTATDRQASSEAGYNLHLVKPFDCQKLKNLLGDLERDRGSSSALA